MNSPFQKLLALVALDAAIMAKQTECGAVQKMIDHEYQALDELEKLRRQHTAGVDEARAVVDEYEKSMQSLQQRESKKKKLIDVSNNLKEFNSAKAELATVQEELVAQEEALLEAWNRLEAAQKTLAMFNATYQARYDEIQTKITELGKKIAEIESAITTIQSGRPACLAQVPAEWLAQYNQMHTQVADPVAPLIDDACSVCFNPVPTQFIGRIAKGAILPCKGCYRLLYSPVFHTGRE